MRLDEYSRGSTTWADLRVSDGATSVNPIARSAHLRVSGFVVRRPSGAAVPRPSVSFCGGFSATLSIGISGWASNSHSQQASCREFLGGNLIACTAILSPISLAMFLKHDPVVPSHPNPFLPDLSPSRSPASRISLPPAGRPNRGDSRWIRIHPCRQDSSCNLRFQPQKARTTRRKAQLECKERHGFCRTDCNHDALLRDPSSATTATVPSSESAPRSSSGSWRRRSCPCRSSS